jgi:hypothetical protein
MQMRATSRAAAAAALWLLPALAQGAPYPPVDQKLPPIVLKSHGVFWAGGQIVNRTQTGTENAGDQKGIAFNAQQYLVGQAYVEYFIPQKLRKGKNTIPIVLVPGGGLVGVHFLTTPDGREGWADYFLRRGFPDAGAQASAPMRIIMCGPASPRPTRSRNCRPGTAPPGSNGIPGRCRPAPPPRMGRTIRAASATMPAIPTIRRSIATAT